jgi:hypothetical protein
MWQKDLTTIWSEYMTGTLVKRCCHIIICGVMWIGKDVKGSFHDKFGVLWGLEQMWNDAVMTEFEDLCGMGQMIRDAVMTHFEMLGRWKLCESKLSRPLWDTIWIGTDMAGFCHDLIWVDLWIGTDDKGWCHDLFCSAKLITKDVTERFDDKLEWIYD